MDSQREGSGGAPARRAHPGRGGGGGERGAGWSRGLTDATHGTVAEEGAEVDITVSREKLVAVPDLRGRDKQSAVELLSSLGLVLGKIVEKLGSLPTGTVMEQSPPAASMVERGEGVDLIVSKYSVVVVPRLLGRRPDEAEKMLEESSLRVGTISRKPSDEREGVVIEQSPLPGTTVSPDSAVNLVLSKHEKVRVPNLRNLTVESAGEELKKHRLSLGKVTRRKSAIADGLVIDQMPGARSEAEPGSSMDIVVSDNPERKVRGISERGGVHAPLRFRTKPFR